jgi:hypothetical protein
MGVMVLRYFLYALAALSALAAYIVLDEKPLGAPVVAKRHSVEAVSLAPLDVFDEGTARAARRDLFFPVRTEFEAAIAPTGAAQAAPAELAPEKTDPYVGVRVIGFLESGRSPRVLIAIGSALKTISVGERFGARGALSVSSIEGRSVGVVDCETNAIRTFALSDE